MNGWRFSVLVTLFVVFCGAAPQAKHPDERATVAVTLIGYVPTPTNERQAMNARNLIMSDVRASGFNAVPGMLICDDPNDGAQKLGAQYYILITPSNR